MSDSLVTLLHLCDSLFPVGGFAHSDGLEAATSKGDIADASGLQVWMDAMLDGVLAWCDGPAVLEAWEAFEAFDVSRLRTLDEDLHALKPSSTARQASRGMGTRLMRTWQEIRPSPRLTRFAVDFSGTPQLTYPVAFGAVAASADVAGRDAVTGYIYTRLAATISAAMRLAPIGQTEGHALLSQTLLRVPAVVNGICGRRLTPRAFAPAFDIAVISQQYVHSRLFRS